MISEDKKQLPHILSCISDEVHQRELQTEDEEEDYLDESKITINFNIKLFVFKNMPISCISIWYISHVQLSDGSTVNCMHVIFGNNVISPRDL